jgi:uncharacterized protein
LSLLQWQQQLLKAIDTGGADDYLMHSQVRGKISGLSIYRNNCEQALVKALMTTFPLCLATVGEYSFRELSRRYIDHYPCGSDGLNGYGEYLFEFVDSCVAHNDQSFNYDYLSDLIKLEWLIQKAHFAKSTRQFDFSRFSSLTQAQQHSIVFEMSDHCALISSEFPLSEIWRRHKCDLESVFIDEEPDSDCFCIYRDEYKVDVCKLSKIESSVLSDIASGVTLKKLGMNSRSSVDLACLASFVQKGWVDGFTLVED